MNKLYKALLVCLLLCSSSQLIGQGNKVTGTVKGAEDGAPLIGVTILGSSGTGTVTDIDGNFSIMASSDETLQFSYIGYLSQSISVGNRSTIDVVLEADLQQLEEIVVTALGIERDKKALGYSITEVGSENITRNGEINAINSLAGKVAGINISTTTAGPSGSSRVIIRGISEIDGSNQPLYVIDGVPVDNGTLGQADQNGGFDLGDGLSDINPDDIESISVLKGASAAALYGSRALNGVILVTTKKGSKGGKGWSIDFNSTVTLDKISTKLDERQEVYGQGSNGALPESIDRARNITSSWGAPLDPSLTVTQVDGTDRPYGLVSNNIQGLFDTGVTYNNTVALSGGDENANIRLSFTDIDNSDILPNSGLDRQNATLRAYSKLGKYVEVDGKLSYITEKVKNRPALTDEVTNIGNGIIGLAPNFDQAWLKTYKNDDGTYLDYTGNIYRANPYWTINETYNNSEKDRILGFGSVKVNFTDWLSLKVRSGLDYFTFNHHEFYNKYTPTKEGGQMVDLTTTLKETNNDFLLSANRDLSDDFSMSLSAGGNLMHSKASSTRISGSEIIIEGVDGLNNFQNIVVTPGGAEKKVNSLYGFASFSYKNYLYLDLTGRNDWFSTLPSKNRSQFYPSVSTSFILSDAVDLGLDALSFFKIRASYAEVGGDAAPYQLANTYSLTGLSHLGVPLAEISGNQISNPDLKPERTKSIELGTDIRFFEGRVGLDFAYYTTTTDDLIFNAPVGETTGYRSAIVNSGQLKNEGIELLLNTTPLKLANGLQWDLSLNFAKNKTTVESLHPDIPVITIADARWAGVKIIAEEGSEFGLITGRGFLRDDEGNIIHGADGMPRLTEEPIELGSTLPDWTAGAITTLSYKGISLKASFDVRMGGDIFAVTNMTMYGSGAHPETLEGREGWNDYAQRNRDAQDAWVDAGNAPEDFVNLPIDGGYIGHGVKETAASTDDNPEYEANDQIVNPADYWNFVSSNVPEKFVYDASYVKLRDLSLAYTLPRSILDKTPFTNVRFAVIGRNLWTLYKNVPNIDPESTYNNGNGQGLEYGSLPTRRHYGFTLNVSF